MTEQLRRGLTAKLPPVVLRGEVEIDEVYVVAGHKGNPAAVAKGAPGAPAAAEGCARARHARQGQAAGPGPAPAGGDVVVRMLANVQQVTIRPVIEATVAKGALVHTDEYDVYERLDEWGYRHKTVCHARGEYARDEDGDGFCEVHVNTAEGFWSLLRPGCGRTVASRRRSS